MVTSTETRPPVTEGSLGPEDFRREMDEFLAKARVELQRYYTEVEQGLGVIATKYGVARPDTEHVRSSLLSGIASDETGSTRWRPRRTRRVPARDSAVIVDESGDSASDMTPGVRPGGAESGRNRRLGMGILGAGAGAWLGSRFTSRRMQFRDRIGRPMHERYERQSRTGKVTLAAGALLVGYLTYKFGEVTIFDFGDGKDKGIDLLPDFLDGNDGGVDFNARNESHMLNDDPNPRPSDLIPDADVDIPDVDIDPDVDADVDSDLDVGPDVDVDPPEDIEIEPDIDVPEVQPEPVAPDPWQPDTFYVQPGSGFEQEIHELGHELVGQQFTGRNAHEVYVDTVNTFGAELLQGAEGNEMHTIANNWISAPGLAQWDSSEIERFVHDRIREAAGV